MTEETNVTTTPMQPVSLPKNKPNDALSILALFGNLTDIGLDPCEELPRVPAPMTKPQAAEQEMIWSLDDIRREEMLFERALPALPEDIRYVSQAIGDVIQSWGVGRYVIDAGTGAGKTTAIIDLSCVSEIRFYYRDVERKALLDSIPPDEKVIVFVSSRATLEKMKLIYGDAASYYCSDHNKSGAMDTLYDCVRHGKLLKRILFTTTVFYNGVDIKDETVKHIFIEQWLPMEVIQEIGRKRPVSEQDTFKLYLRGKGKRELETRLKEATYNLEPALCYRAGGETWEKFLAAPDVNERIGEESTLYYDHRTKEYHINEMKEMFFQYQKSVALKMLQDGYHDAILSMIRGDLGSPVPEYKSDNVSAYIAEHLNEPMLKDELKAALIRVLNIVPAKGRSSQETIGKLLLNRELQKYGVEIITTRETAGKWRFKTVWMLVELK